jgi:hypothetical protein
MDSKKADLKPCTICNGSGKVVVGYGVVCIEIVEKVEKCPACSGNGFLEPDSSFERVIRHYSKS